MRIPSAQAVSHPAPRTKTQRGLAWQFTTPLVAVLCLTAAPEANALSFTGPFAQENWTLSRDPAGTPEATADFEGDNLIFATPIGLGDNVTFNLASGEVDQLYSISFDYTYAPDNDLEPALATYSICTTSGCGGPTGFTLIPNTPVPSFFLASGEFLKFSIVNTTDSFGGELSISNFSATPVPAPLPAAGAATAFGYSRRLRRRIKGKQSAGSCPPVLPAHPAAYLTLTPAALKSIPVSFSYASRTIEADQSQQAA